MDGTALERVHAPEHACASTGTHINSDWPKDITMKSHFTLSETYSCVFQMKKSSKPLGGLLECGCVDYTVQPNVNGFHYLKTVNLMLLYSFFLSPSFSTYKSFKNEWSWFGMAPTAQGEGLVRYKNFGGSGETTSQVISFPLFQGENLQYILTKHQVVNQAVGHP